MKYIFFFLWTVSSLFAEVYYAKVEPYKIYAISSDVMGAVTHIHEDLLGKKLSKEVYIKIDDKLDREELYSVKQKLHDLKSTLKLSEEMARNLKEVLAKKRANYKRVLAMKVKSKIEKDREFYDLIATQNSYIATQKEINSLRVQIADLSLRKKVLYKTIHDKNLKAPGLTLYSIKVEEGQVVTKGTPLAQLADLSKGLLTIYLTKEDLMQIGSSVVYINGKKTSYTISRYSTIADAQNLSKYKAQIVIDPPKIFSQLVKVELKKD